MDASTDTQTKHHEHQSHDRQETLQQQQQPQPNQQDADEDNDEAQDEFPSPPVWASSSATTGTPPQDLTPPPTYDPSTFMGPMSSVPTFKPRKSNRISVLAYPTDGSQPPVPAKSPATPPSGAGTIPAPQPLGGPPGLFGSGATPGLSSTPTPPPTLGMKLPPPPMKNAGSGPAPVPYTKGDFRTAGIVNHWNDPPTQIFANKVQNDESTAYDFGPMEEKLTAIIKECSANVPAPQKRMFEDTTKRLQGLQDQMDKGTVKERVVVPLGDMIQALSSRSFTQCHAIHAKLMQTEFESEGKWLLGFKRLIDLYASLPPTSSN
ncbi:hypothetical protein EDD21DRAFT_369629 [Dissophora ornata]|nr:hypothetical protein BGZ58_003215 [Dissophora ornata]KAI8603266.1 hypothetical protein EDD21DRAFT_369629 [Dissophora ornata]